MAISSSVRDPPASAGFSGGEKGPAFTSVRLLPLPSPVEGFCQDTPATQSQRVATSPPATERSFECVSFSFRTKVGVRAWQRGGRKVRGVCREKKHREKDPRERERGKHQSSGRWAFSTFPLKRKKKKKVFRAVGSKNRQEGAEAGGFAAQAAGRL